MASPLERARRDGRRQAARGCGAAVRSAGAAAGGRVGFGGDAGGDLLAEADVAAEAGQVLVAGLGLKLGRSAAVGGQVLQGRMAQLMQGPALLLRVERLARLLGLGARLGQPVPPG
jgi:hypothetical protein